MRWLTVWCLVFFSWCSLIALSWFGWEQSVVHSQEMLWTTTPREFRVGPTDLSWQDHGTVVLPQDHGMVLPPQLEITIDYSVGVLVQLPPADDVRKFIAKHPQAHERAMLMVKASDGTLLLTDHELFALLSDVYKILVPTNAIEAVYRPPATMLRMQADAIEHREAVTERLKLLLDRLDKAGWVASPP